MSNDPENNIVPEGDSAPERPLECTECRKAVAVYYTEIVGNTIVRTCMCNDCPILRHKLHGLPSIATAPGQEVETKLACGHCGTTLEEIRVGTPLGCDVCYEVFDMVLLAEMQAAEKLPARVNVSKKTAPVHIGRAPGEQQEINPSLRLIALNEALSEMLKSEDYEQAALLRDQIKALTEKKQENKDGKTL